MANSTQHGSTDLEKFTEPVKQDNVDNVDDGSVLEIYEVAPQLLDDRALKVSPWGHSWKLIDDSPGAPEVCSICGILDYDLVDEDDLICLGKQEKISDISINER